MKSKAKVKTKQPGARAAPTPPSEGLLKRFIDEKAAAYTPPTRKGTPFGQKIGFPAKKYLTSLGALTAVPRKQLAQAVGTSYEVVLQWFCESEFKHLVATHSNEFADRFIALAQQAHTQGLSDEPPAELMMDAELYSAELLRGILPRALETQGHPSTQFTLTMRLRSYLLAIAEARGDTRTATKLRLHLRNWCCAALSEKARRLVLTAPMPAETQKTLARVLAVLAQEAVDMDALIHQL